MSRSSTLEPLDEVTQAEAVARLCERDAGFESVIAKWGHPPFWTHDPGFPGLVSSILAQQISLESAQSTFAKLADVLGSVEPEGFLTLEDDTLKSIGFSRQKVSYVRGLARGIVEGEIDLDALASMSNDEARESLVAVRGIGKWTADSYLLFALRRVDAWPSGDLALAKAIEEVRGMEATPSYKEVDRIAEEWKPWRSVAARLLWHHYLCERGRGAPV